MTPGVSIVIPSWNGLSLLERFLPSVQRAAEFYSDETNSPVEIVVVDDGSDDGTSDWLLTLGFTRSIRSDSAMAPFPGKMDTGPSESTRLILVNNDCNAGFGEACNRGFAIARHKLVFLVNNDVEVSREVIKPLVECFSDPAVFAAHCRVFDLESGREVGTGKLGSFSRGFIRVHRSYVPTGPGITLYSMFAGGGSSMFDRDKFIEMSGFDRLLTPFYWEDVELSIRAWKRGYTVLYQPRAVVRHRISSTIRHIDRSKVERIQRRNRLIYHWIHLHDTRMMISHVAWVMFLAVVSPFTLKAGFLASCLSALARIGAIRRRRRQEKAAAKRTDRELFDVFNSLQRRPEIFSYDDHRELDRVRTLTPREQQPS